MAMFPKPKHKGGKRPPLGKLNAYLANEEKREAVMFLDGNGNVIRAEETTRAFGGYNGEHWHAIVAPSHQECSMLTERYGSQDKGAIEHGKALAARLQTDLKMKNPPVMAIHFEHDKAGNFRWHYHMVGEGKANGRLWGENGKLQKAWDRETFPDRKPIVNWRENQLYKQAKTELTTIQKELRKLASERQTALKAAKLPWDKSAVRDQFTGREIALINQRHALETKAANHRYASRADTGSTAHQVELQKINDRKAAAMKRLDQRGQDPKAISRINAKVSKGFSAAKRGATKGASVVAKAAAKINQDLKQAVEKGRAPDPHRAEIEIPGAGNVKAATVGIVGGAIKTAAEAAQAVATAASKATIHTGKAAATMAVGLVAALPTGGGSIAKASESAGRDLAEGAKETGKELGQGVKRTAAEAAHTGAQAGKTLASSGFCTLPPAAQGAIRAGISAGKAAAATVKDAATLDIGGAAGNLLVGGAETAKHAVGAAIEGAKGLPPIIGIPIKALEIVPLVGTVARVARATAEVVATVVPKTFVIDL